MSAALALVLLLAAGGDEVIDLGPLLRPAPVSRAPLLGPLPLRSGSFGFVTGEGEDPPPPPSAEEWLSWIEEAGGPPPPLRRVEGGRYLVLSPAEAAALRPWVASLAADLLRVVRVRVEVTFPDGRVETGEVGGLDGWWASLGPTASRRFHADNDVEIACSNSAEGAPSCIVDPIVGTAYEGLAMDVRSHLLGDDGAVAVEAVVQAGRFDRGAPELDLAARFHGRIRLPRYRGALVSLSGRIAPGGTLEARLAGRDGETIVRLSPRVEGAPGAGPCRLRPGSLPDSEGAPLPPEPEDLPYDRWSVGALPLFAGEASAGPLAREPAEDASRLLSRTVAVELRLRQDGKEVGRAFLSALAGRTAVARVGRDALVLADWDVEVGCYNQIGDPLVTNAFDGLLARVRPRFAPDGRTVVLDLVLTDRATEIGPPRPGGMRVTGPTHPVRSRERGFDGSLVLADGEEARIALGGGLECAVRSRLLLPPGGSDR